MLAAISFSLSSVQTEGFMAPKPAKPEPSQASKDALRAAVADEPGAAWADDGVARRYLRARKFDLEKATAMLQQTLRWRRESAVDTAWTAREAVVRSESATGKLRVSPSCDRDGRPMLVMCPRLENNAKGHEANLQNLVYHMERITGGRPLRGGSPLSASEDGKIVVVLDLKGYSMSNAPPMKTSKATLAILQDHYPERLHKFLILHAPWLFIGFFKVISPFIDPGTRERLIFLSGTEEEQRAVLEKSTHRT